MKGTSNDRKKFQVFQIGILQVTLIAVMLLPLIDSNYHLVVAQISSTGMDNTNSSVFSQPEQHIGGKPSLDSNNFSLEGTITSGAGGSQDQKGGIGSNQSESSLTRSNTSQDIIGGGEWRIDVVNENVENFKSNMTMSRSDGTEMHDHQVEFKSDDPEIMLLPNNSAVISPSPGTVEIAALDPGSGSDKNVTSISQTDDSIMFSGVADITTNGVIEWRGVPMSISIFNGSAINMKLDANITNNHFSDEPISGLVKSIKPINVVQNGTGP
jgi:hypothetical protein